MTLSTARASLRSKEIGVRKVNGAKRKKLITQFLSESLVQAFISLLLALALTELLLPFFNMFVEKDITLQFNWQTLLFVLFGIVGVGCLAGSFLHSICRRSVRCWPSREGRRPVRRGD